MGFQGLKMNKKGLEFRGAIFSIILFSTIIIAFGVIVTDSSTKYPTGETYDLGELNKLDQVSSDANVQKGRISANDPDPGTDAEANTFRGVYGVLTNIYSSLSLVFGEGGMLGNLADRFGVPTYVIQMLITLMIVGITFALIAVIFRLGRAA